MWAPWGAIGRVGCSGPLAASGGENLKPIVCQNIFAHSSAAPDFGRIPVNDQGDLISCGIVVLAMLQTSAFQAEPRHQPCLAIVLRIVM